MKKMWMLLLASFLFTSSASAKEVYVALGDSLAAGQTPYAEIDAGYADLIAMQLKRSGQLASFTKQLAFPGYTVEDVLARIQTEEARNVLRDATLITISAGANDLLSLVSHNPQTGSISYSQLPVNFALNNARKGYMELLEQVKELAPHADVYVMGYYFPYTSVHDTQAQGVEGQLGVLNEILKRTAVQSGAEFVPVAFGDEAPRYLPNPADVHPNMEGYLVMANAFAEKRGLEPLGVTELPEPNPLTFEEIAKQRQAQPVEENEVAAVKPIEEVIIYYGYERWKRFFL
ncbi:MAG: SGNH/GDSL hydrolase family protein [Lysinibacillus sp.]